jgi:hypothetical protein
MFPPTTGVAQNMKPTHKQIIGLLSLILIVPALFFCSSGILYLAFAAEKANRLLDLLVGRPLLKPYFSPVIILGGPLLAVCLNLYQICRVRLRSAKDGIELSLTVRRLLSNLLPVLAGGIILLLLLSYAFVENFKVVPR